MNTEKLFAYVDKCFDEHILPTLCEYIKIPNKSPAFDKNWKENGYMEAAARLIFNWCLQHGLEGMHAEIISLENRTPLLYFDIPGSIDKTVLLYGHLDKQPEMQGWSAPFAPWQPIFKNGKLYGRGGADDGYAAFSAITAIKALKDQNLTMPRCVILIEASEESGSVDLPFYIEHLKDRLGQPELVICLDSGCGNYEQLWMTTSLRGNIVGELNVSLLKEGVHSGNASGIVADSFRIVRQLLSRIEDQNTGECLLPELQVPIPDERVHEARRCSVILKENVYQAFSFQSGVMPVSHNLTELILNRTWRAQLSITGAEGLPKLTDAGNVSRPFTKLKLSMRTPPTCDALKAAKALKKVIEEDPPLSAKINFEYEESASGWNAPSLAPWLNEAVNSASNHYFNKPAAFMGEGGTIPFMAMLGERFKEAQFMITGVLGPKSNAHGPNEFLHIDMAKKITSCVAEVLYRFTCT